MKESLRNKQEYTEEMRTNLEAEAKRIRNRIDKLINEYYDDIIDVQFYNEKRRSWTKNLDDIQIRLEALHNTKKKYYDEGVRFIEASKYAYSLYLQQPPSEKEKC